MVTTSDHDTHVRSYWIPKQSIALDDWVSKKLYRANELERTTYRHSVVQEFRDLIENDAELYLGFHQMFDQMTDAGAVDSYTKMLAVFDVILGEAPPYRNHTLVAFPLTAVIIGPMETEAGYRMFANKRVNAMFRKLLNTWYRYLCTPESRYVLHHGETGWFGPAATAAFPNFAETFLCDPDAPYYGFQSWEDFFCRRFRPGVRPIHFPNDDRIVNNACESSVFRIEYDAPETAQFWLKGHPYSVSDMLAGDELAPQFVGGTVYQAFLHALYYHRWHSPVNGIVVKTVIIPGTYYLLAAGPLNETIPPSIVPGPDMRRLNGSQDYMAQVAARCLVFIQADNPDIGLMCFVGIGMEEVSTCLPTVKAGQRIRKGDEIGSFHYGGSTHCLVFRKETKITFSESKFGKLVPVNAAIAHIG